MISQFDFTALSSVVQGERNKYVYESEGLPSGVEVTLKHLDVVTPVPIYSFN
jgi:hypothetical protein